MNLDLAILKAKEEGFKWLAVNEDGIIGLYMEKPVINTELYQWEIADDYKDDTYDELPHEYTGDINWKETLTYLE